MNVKLRRAPCTIPLYCLISDKSVNIFRNIQSYWVCTVPDNWYLFMQNFSSLWYTMRALLAVSTNFPDNPRTSCIFKIFYFNLLTFILSLVRLPAGLSQKSHSLTFKAAIHDVCDKTILCLSSEVKCCRIRTCDFSDCESTTIS